MHRGQRPEWCRPPHCNARKTAKGAFGPQRGIHCTTVYLFGVMGEYMWLHIGGMWEQSRGHHERHAEQVWRVECDSDLGGYEETGWYKMTQDHTDVCQ